MVTLNGLNTGNPQSHRSRNNKKNRNKKQWEKDRDRTDKEVIVFLIPTRDEAGRIHSKDYDNAQVLRLFRECANGGYWIKPGDIVGTIRQIRNDRHPQHLPITVTCKDKEVAEKVLDAASNIEINGSRKTRPDDEEKGRFGFLRPSLDPRERKAIRDKKRLKATPAGQGQAEIRRRQYESRTGSEEWADLVTEEYNGEKEPHDTMVVDSTIVSTPVKENENQDKNLNRISPQQAAASLKTEQEKEK